jgi:hypothetical protein
VSSLFIDTPYLVFQNHETQNDAPLEAAPAEIAVLRGLAQGFAEIAAHPVNAARRTEWQRLNDLQPSRPLVWMNEICWNEMNVDDELTLRTTSTVCRRIETQLRRTLYQWKHMQGDMVVEAEFPAPVILRNSGFGVEVQADVRETEENREIASRHFHNQFAADADVDKIRDPVIEMDAPRTREFLQFYTRVFEGILPVETRGCTGFWFAPWDDIVFWMGADNVLLGLADRPAFMHALIDRLSRAYIAGLRQFEALGLLSRNDGNMRIGSGGYGYTRDLGEAGRPEGPRKPITLWGSATAQIFGSVSPDMHREFGLAYERRWLELFGLAYYGCCEPLHNKIAVLETLPNLRKISISPWADVAAAAELMRGRYVMSLKPSPALLVGSSFNADGIRQELTTKLAAARGCNVEIILKDISTVCHEPRRLWEWARIARETIQAVS